MLRHVHSEHRAGTARSAIPYYNFTVGWSAISAVSARWREKAWMDSGYRWCGDLALTRDDFDLQGHLNHIAAFRTMTRLRAGYLSAVFDGEWHRQVREGPYTWVVGEAHLRYASEGLPHETYQGRARAAFRSGRAVIIEAELLAGATRRVVVQAYTVQLIIRDGVAQPWPDDFIARIEAFEGYALTDMAGRRRVPFGPFAAYGAAAEPLEPETPPQGCAAIQR